MGHYVVHIHGDEWAVDFNGVEAVLSIALFFNKGYAPRRLGVILVEIDVEITVDFTH